MKLRTKSRKKIIAVCALVSALSLGGVTLLLLLGAAKEEPMPRREYPVKRDSITVGIDATGAIASEKQSQFSDTPVLIGRYRVKVGDFVRKGDVLAELSPEDLTQRLKDATQKLKDENFALTKLQTEKQNHQLELDKKIKDVRDAGETAHQDKAGALLAKKTVTEKSIADKKAMIDQQKAAIAALQAERDGRPEKILAYDAAIAALQTDNAALQTKIDALLADTGTDHSAEIAQLSQKKAENEIAILDKTREKEHLQTTDFDALTADANKQIALLENEITALGAELTATQSSLAAIDAQRQKERSKEDDSVALLIKQAQAQHADYDHKISQAQTLCADAKKARDTLLALQASPEIVSQHEGVVVKLGYAPNAVTEATISIADIGADNQKLLLLHVDPMDIADVALGQEVSFYVDAYPDATFYGTVQSKAYLQNESGKFEVSVSFSQTEQPLLDGMGANATLIVKQKRDILTLPNKAFFLEDGKAYVHLADENGALQRREITTGFSNGRSTEIIKGLADGDIVYVEERYEAS